jgi:hypothetical protein
MIFFDYLFCRLYWWNTQIIKEKDIPVGYSVVGLSVFQACTVLPIYMLLYYFKVWTGDYDILNIDPGFVFVTIIIIANYFYFKKERYTVLLKKFDKMQKSIKRKIDILCIVYILMIIISNVVIVIVYRAENVLNSPYLLNH